jgi:hypothetical protein
MSRSLPRLRDNVNDPLEFLAGQGERFLDETACRPQGAADQSA